MGLLLVVASSRSRRGPIPRDRRGAWPIESIDQFIRVSDGHWMGSIAWSIQRIRRRPPTPHRSGFGASLAQDGWLVCAANARTGAGPAFFDGWHSLAFLIERDARRARGCCSVLLTLTPTSTPASIHPRSPSVSNFGGGSMREALGAAQSRAVARASPAATPPRLPIARVVEERQAARRRLSIDRAPMTPLFWGLIGLVGAAAGPRSQHSGLESIDQWPATASIGWRACVWAVGAPRRMTLARCPVASATRHGRRSGHDPKQPPASIQSPPTALTPSYHVHTQPAGGGRSPSRCCA